MNEIVTVGDSKCTPALLRLVIKEFIEAPVFGDT